MPENGGVMKNYKICPHCGATLDLNRLCRACLLAEAKRLIAQLTDSQIAEIMQDVFKLDTEEQEGYQIAGMRTDSRKA